MRTPDAPPRCSSGLVLIELLLGLTIGLLVVLAACTAGAALMQAVASGRDAADLQQRADAALRIIGRQVQQAGSVRLLQDGEGAAVRFNTAFSGWGDTGRAVSGVEGGPGMPDLLRVSYEPDSVEDRDGVGFQANKPGAGKIPGEEDLDRFDSVFYVGADATDQGRRSLYGKGARLRSRAPQALVGGVDDLQLRFGIRMPDGAVSYRDADELAADAVVLAVEVCLQLASENRHGTSGARDCRGQPLAAPQQQGRLIRLVRGIFRVNNAG